MLIKCPNCGFSKAMPDEAIPRQKSWVTCPQCFHRFLFCPLSAADEKDGDETAEKPSPRQSGAAEASPAETPKAGFWIRALAAVVDSVLVSLVQLVLVSLLVFVLGLADTATSDTRELMTGLAGLFSAFISIVYYVFFIGYCGQTPGKMALRVKVIRTTGEEMGFYRAFLREVVGKFISFVFICIGYLWVSFDPQKQGWHDKIAGTYVIKLL